MIRVMVTAKGIAGLSEAPVEMELSLGSTVATVLDLVLAAEGRSKHDTGPQVLHSVITTVNGRYVPVSQVQEWALAAGDQITVMPLIVGG